VTGLVALEGHQALLCRFRRPGPTLWPGRH